MLGVLPNFSISVGYIYDFNLATYRYQESAQFCPKQSSAMSRLLGPFRRTSSKHEIVSTAIAIGRFRVFIGPVQERVVNCTV